MRELKLHTRLDIDTITLDVSYPHCGNVAAVTSQSCAQRKTLRQFVGAGHAPPATYRKAQPDGQPIGRAMLAPTTLGKRSPYILPALRELKLVQSDIRHNKFSLMYLTRVAGMLLRLPCKAVRNANARAGHAPPLQCLGKVCRVSYPRCGN